MKLNKGFTSQLQTILDQYVTFDYEHNKLWSNWCKVTGIEAHVDASGEFTECKFFLKDIVTGKDMYAVSITELYALKDVEAVWLKILPLVNTIEASNIDLEYTNPIMVEYKKIINLMHNYPSEKLGVPSV